MDLLLICLPTSIEPHILTDPYSLLTKEKITRPIESGGQSAAAVLCCVGKEFPPHESRTDFIEDIVGLVALIGKAWTIKLSRLMVALGFLQKMKAHNHLMEVLQRFGWFIDCKISGRCRSPTFVTRSKRLSRWKGSCLER
ncbi:uncharacterized protein LOC116136068 [Pistacia vera]|uniref:uncharacterized protein LOC116136068 n=1 Tax=Pistacia vera TaxID=55513 RepID=UPI001262B5EB|nr:uncharacterized protein LOC116136068 [Pistacia vera]